MLKSNLTLKSLLRSLAIVVVVLAVVLVVIKVKAGDSLDPPGPPTPGTMKTLDQLYCKLKGGADCPGDEPSLDPTAAPTSTMHTIKDVYDAAPGVSEMTTESGEVLCGEKFFGTGGTETGSACPLCKENCTGGSCAPIADGQEDNTADIGELCQQVCKKCDGAGNCVNIPASQGDNIGINQCLESDHKKCDGSGNCLPFKRVFITNSYWTGNLKGGEATGLEGADAKCQTAAENAGLGGNWTAWLSSSSTDTNAADRVTHSPGGYVLVDNITVVATSWEDLIDFFIDNPISMDEYGTPPITTTVWTNTTFEGRKVSNHDCNEIGSWESASVGNTGVMGSANYTNSAWTYAGSSTCSHGYGLYCFED